METLKKMEDDLGHPWHFYASRIIDRNGPCFASKLPVQNVKTCKIYYLPVKEAKKFVIFLYFAIIKDIRKMHIEA